MWTELLQDTNSLFPSLHSFPQSASESDMALALNRYVCASVLPLLTANAEMFDDADHATQLMDQTLKTVYQLSKCRSLTKNQRDMVSDFLVALTRYNRMYFIQHKMTT